MSSANWELLAGASDTVAPLLLGAHLVRELKGRQLVGKIVEVEAYDQADAASHSFHGSLGRAAVTFGPAGHLYVHATRHHFCCDITTGREGYGSSILIRAIEPIEGIEQMRLLRGVATDAQLTNGPAKLCQATAINMSLNGHDLRESPLKLLLGPPLADDQIVRSTRIGITKDTHRLWRFYVKDSPFVSRGT